MSRIWSRCSISRPLAVAGVLWLLGTASGAETSRSPVGSDPRYQTELPLAGGSPSGPGGGGDGSDRPAPGGAAPRNVGAPDGGTRESGSFDLGPLLASLPVGFSWLLLAILAIGLVLAGVKAFLRPRADPDGTALPPSLEAAAGRDRAATPADRLAAEGRWAEALQALLGEALRTLGERFRVPLPPARTSREALRALPLQGDPREALRALVTAEERSLFGGEPVGAPDYGRALELARRALGGRTPS